MRYLLTEEEYQQLQETDARFEKLYSILHSIDTETTRDETKLDLFRSLVDDLGRASQEGTIDKILENWKNWK